jgi:YD repeat-containing protein
MKRTLLLYVLFLTLGTRSFAQTGMNENYDPPSPEASALGKYVDHPVGNFTGTPKIEIPLFEIKTGRITVPITISYHGSGVKVDEIASRTGIGWVLNAGGAISRTVKGWPDDVNIIESGYFSSNHTTSLSFIGSGTTPTMNDLEPDVHYYNFGNKSGKIYFNSPTTAFTVNKDPMKIDGPYNGNNRFIITTEDGLIYTFAASEQNSSTVDNVGYICNSAWYLTNIEDPVSGKSVQFIYRTDMAASYQYNYSKGNITNNGFACGGENYGATGIIQDIVGHPQVLQKIVYDEGYIEFKADENREDLTGDRAYTEINQYITVGSTPMLKKGFNLHYHYTSNGSTPDNQRLYLESIQEKGSDGSTSLPPYFFFYKNRDLVPERNSPQQDIWGYYNANNAQYVDFQFPKVYVHTHYDGTGRDFLPFDGLTNPSTDIIAGVERSGNPSTADYGTLNKIVYPTTGYTTYAYEIHQFDDYQGGGIRIKEIDDFSSNGTMLLSKKYTYSNGFLGGAYPQVAIPAASGILRTNVNKTVLGSCDGGYVGYAQVSVTESSPTNGSTNGTTVYQYTTDKDVPGSFTATTNGCSDLSNLNDIRSRSLFPFFEWESRENRRGVLSNEAYYDSQGNEIKNVAYYYTLNTTVANIIHSNFVIFIPDDEHPYIMTSLDGDRNLNQEKMLLTTKVETLYKGNNPAQPLVNNTTAYTYTDGAYDGAFIRTEEQFSSNSIISYHSINQQMADAYTQTLYKYPFDYAPTASGGVMGQMVAMNYINPVISQINTRTKVINSNSVTYYIDARINDYMYNPLFPSGTAPNAIVPKQVFQLNLSTLVQQQSAPSSNTSIEVADPSNPGALYDKRLEYLNYDIFSNPTIVKNDNLYQTLSWSIFGQLLSKSQSTDPSVTTTFPFPPESWSPVNDPNAKFDGVDYVWNGDYTSFLFRPDGITPTTVSFWAKGGTFSIEVGGDQSTPDIDVENQVAPANWKYYSFTLPTFGQGFENAGVYLIGTATLDGISISNDSGLKTTYSYDALQRLESIIDPSNKLRSFEYDPYSRLINTRDQNGNLLNRTDYHYIGQ